MLVIRRHRDTHPCRRMLLAVVLLSGLVKHCEAMSVKRMADSSSSSSPTLSRTSAESKSQNLGSPSDLAWQAWLLLDSQTGAHTGLDSASFLRRITPKSVFIAPALPALPPCADGYRADTMGRCVKNVNIDHEAHLGFLLQRLNNRYGNRGGNADAQSSSSSSSNSSQKKSTGPLQLNIPLLAGIDTKSSQLDHVETGDSVKIPIIIPARVDESANREKHPLESVVAIAYHHARNNSEAVGAENGDSFSGSVATVPSSKDDPGTVSKVDAAIPVAEFVDETNDTNFSGVVDYKIPIDLRAILNISDIRTINSSEETDAWRNGSQYLNSTEASPMLILLSSTSATSPNLLVPGTEDSRPALNDTSRRAIVRASNLTRNVTDKEIIGPSVPEAAPPSKGLDVPPIVVERIEPADTRDGNSAGIRKTAGQTSQEIESFYDDADDTEFTDYADSTDPPDEESSETEGGEILKHGEAGMAIPVKDIERLQQEKRRKETEKLQLDEARSNETSMVEHPSVSDEISIRFNDSAKPEKEEKDEIVSNVSSEVSIKGDMILETTLLDVTRNGSRMPETNRPSGNSSVEDGDEDPREPFEPARESNTEPEVALSPQNDRDASEVSGSSRERIRADEGLAEKSDELEASPSSSETVLYDPDTRDRYTEVDPIAEIRTIDDQAANSKEAFFPKKSKGSDFFRTYEPETLNFRPTLDYYAGRPTYPRQPMRFPSEEVNSIHRQRYKEGIPYPMVDDGLHSSTKSSVFGHRKPFHRGAALWRTFPRQQHLATGQQVETTASSSQRQKLPPLSVSFWTAMPLMRDPSLYASNQSVHGKTPTSVVNERSFASNRFPLVSPS